MKNDIFEVRPDVICHYYHGQRDSAIADILSDFLRSKGRWAFTSDLYKSFIRRNNYSSLIQKLPDKEAWLSEAKVSTACCRTMVKQMQTFPDITKARLFNTHIYHFLNLESKLVAPQAGVILNQRVAIPYKKYPKYFRKLFAYIFLKTDTPELFFKHHLRKTFKSNITAFKTFLLEVERENSKMLFPHRTIWAHLTFFVGGIKGNIDGTPKVSGRITHREYQAAYDFSVEAGLNEPLTAKQLKEISHKRYLAKLSLSRGSKAVPFKAITLKESKNIMSLLADSPKARALAIRAFKKIVP